MTGQQRKDQENGGLSAMIEAHITAYFAAHEGVLPASADLYDVILREVEEPLLRQTLSACNGNQIKAAVLLGLNRNTLRKKIEAHGIAVRRPRKKARKKE